MVSSKNNKRWVPLFLIVTYAAFAGLSFQFFHDYMKDLTRNNLQAQRWVGIFDILYILASLLLIALLTYWLVRLIRTYESAISESEARFRGIVDATPDMIWECNRQFEFQFVSQESAKLLGCEAADCIGKTPFDFMPLQSRLWQETNYSTCAEEGKPINALEVLYQHADYSVTIAEVNARPLYNKKGEMIGYIGVERDITERRQAERVLDRTNDFYRILFDNFPLAIWRTNSTGRISYLNNAAISLLTHSLTDIGEFSELIHPDDRQGFRQSFDQALCQECQIAVKYRLRQLNGEYRNIKHVGSPCWDANSTFLGFIGYFMSDAADNRINTSDLPIFFS